MRQFFGGAAVVAAAVLLGVLLLEGALRLAGISYPDFFRDDPVLGRTLSPGTGGWWTSEGRAWVQINSDGLRDREHTLDKPPDTLRIAVLGDSYAAAFEVPAEAAFWSVMQKELAGCPGVGGRQVEVINFGLGGSGTATELLMLQNRVWKYRPDVVLLAFHAGNDISDNSRALKGSSRAPYFVYDGDGRLVLDPAFVEKRAKLTSGPLDELWYGLLNRSRVLQVVMQAWRQAKLVLREDVTHEEAGQEAGLRQQVYAPPSNPVWQEAWLVTEGLLTAMSTEVDLHGAVFGIVTLSTGVQVNFDPSARQHLAKRLGVDDLLYADRRVAFWAQRQGVPSLTLAPSLLAWAETNKTCVHGFDNATPCGGHWNEHGHRIAGERIAEFMCPLLEKPASVTSRKNISE